MDVRLSSTGLAWDGAIPPPALPGLLDAVLRGVGQVMLQNNSYAGLLFLIGILHNSPLCALAAFVGAATSTATAAFLGVDRSLVRAGVFGFNGSLVAIALVYFLRPDGLTWGCVVFAAACSTVVTAALMNLLGTWKIPPLTAPFVFSALPILLATAHFGRLRSTHLPTAGLPGAVAVEGVVTAATIAQGLFNGIAQVFLQENVVTGILFAVGLLISSRVACAAALAGSLAGLIVAWGMGAAEPAIRSGAFGFNSALVAIALVGVFFVLDTVSVACALLATMAAAVVFAALSAALEPLGMPALTFPFVLVVWCFLFASRHLPRLRAATAA